MPRRSLSTEPEKETQLKAGEEKPTPLKMDKVIACKGIRMNRPGQEEIEFELGFKEEDFDSSEASSEARS